jgi:hypothetical protein
MGYPPPAPKKSALPLILAIGILVLIIGVGGVLLVNLNKSDLPSNPSGQTTDTAPPSTAPTAPSTFKPPSGNNSRTAEIVKAIDSGRFRVRVDIMDLVRDYHVGYNMIALVESPGIIRTVCRDGKTYTLIDTMRSGKVSDGTEVCTDSVNLLFPRNLIYQESGSEQILGKTSDYDLYIMPGGSRIKYFVDGGRFIALRAGGLDVEILEFSNTPSDGVFEIPSDYTISQ